VNVGGGKLHPYAIDQNERKNQKRVFVVIGFPNPTKKGELNLTLALSIKKEKDN